MGNIYQIRCCFSKLKSKTNYSYNYAKCKQNRFLSYRLCKGSSNVLVDSFDQTIWEMLHWNNATNLLLLALLTNLFTKNFEHYFRIKWFLPEFLINDRRTEIYCHWLFHAFWILFTFECQRANKIQFILQVCDILSYSLILF